MSVRIINASALSLPLDDDTVDLVVTSPPYFALRSYTDAGVHYPGQVGSEPTPAAFLDALLAATREMVRVLKPSGSLWVNLGDKYGPDKGLRGLPWRYALRCVDDLGLILRAEVVWSKPNGLPESVRDRVRRSHEQWFHFTLRPNYYANVDEVREPHVGGHSGLANTFKRPNSSHDLVPGQGYRQQRDDRPDVPAADPLGKLPGSVWTIATQPLRVPADLGVDHFAAFPMEWPRRIITGWSPPGICTACGEGRRATSATTLTADRGGRKANVRGNGREGVAVFEDSTTLGRERVVSLTGYACACPTPDAPTLPAVVLDPFGGTGTTALVADVLGRDGISVDLSSDYCRLARWRTADPKERARVLKVKTQRAPTAPVLVTPVDPPAEDTTLW